MSTTTPMSLEEASAEAVRLSQAIMDYQPGSSTLTPDAFEKTTLDLLTVHDDVIVPSMLAESNDRDATKEEALVSGMRIIGKAFAVACTHLPFVPDTTPLCTWQRLVNTLVSGASHPAAPFLGRAFVCRCLTETVAWADFAEGGEALATALRHRSHYVARSLVQIVLTVHAQTSTSESTRRVESQQLGKVACASLLQLSESTYSVIAEALVEGLPASLDAAVLLVHSPDATTAFYAAMEAALFSGARLPGLETSADLATLAEVSAARSALVTSLRERYPDFGRVAPQYWSNALLATPKEGLFSSLRAVEQHTQGVVLPLLAACQASRQRRQRPSEAHTALNAAKPADQLVRENVSLTFLCVRFAALWQWFAQETQREDSALREACATAALRLGRAYTELATFTAMPVRGTHPDALAGEDDLPEQGDVQDEKAAQLSASPLLSARRMAALIPSEAELAAILAPLASMVEEAEVHDRERHERRLRRQRAVATRTAETPGSHASEDVDAASDADSETSSSSSPSSSSDEDDCEDESCEKANTQTDKTLPSVLDAPLPLLECFLLLLSRLLPFVSLTANVSDAPATTEPNRHEESSAVARPRQVMSTRMHEFARAAHALHYHTLPALKDILSLSARLPAAAKEEAVSPHAQETDDTAREQADVKAVLESLCGLCVGLWRATGSGHTSRRWAARAPAGLAQASWTSKATPTGLHWTRGSGGGGGGERGPRREKRKRHRH